MTALLESPVGTLDVTRLEERQPDVPLTCTAASYPLYDDRCVKPAAWEALCMACGHVFRRCEEHHAEEVEDAEWNGNGVCGQCAPCVEVGRTTYIYIEQYGRIGA